MFKHIISIVILVFFSRFSLAQIDTTINLTFDFNEGIIKEKDNKVILKPIGISLVKDRFGNENSAIQTHGHNSSYLNLGTSNLLKPKKGTISLWVNLEIRTYFGKGADFNPFLCTKNAQGFDFVYSYFFGYECN